MTILRLHSGAWQIAAMVGGYRMSRAYYGYSKREAVKLFRAAL